MFQQIPLWLHVNAPQLPGYVNEPGASFGISFVRHHPI
ncbi:MAG: hypothetical protein JRH15_16770 [Deltaproteobacteria bacterium]|nr:hypothetical protein [Deltaproteobacteria bacterium]